MASQIPGGRRSRPKWPWVDGEHTPGAGFDRLTAIREHGVLLDVDVGVRKRERRPVVELDVATKRTGGL